MALKCVLDTNCVLYLLNGSISEPLPEAEYFVSVITELELLSYPLISAVDEFNIRDFLTAVQVVDLDQEIKNRTISLRQKYNLKLPDAIVAATALVKQATLATQDSDFNKVKELTIRSFSLRTV